MMVQKNKIFNCKIVDIYDGDTCKVSFFIILNLKLECMDMINTTDQLITNLEQILLVLQSDREKYDTKSERLVN